MAMAKQKVTMTLDSGTLAALRRLVGRRELSAAVNDAVAGHVKKLEQFAAIDLAIAEHEAKHGPIPQKALDWAEREIDAWTADVARREVKAKRRARKSPPRHAAKRRSAG